MEQDDARGRVSRQLLMFLLAGVVVVVGGLGAGVVFGRVNPVGAARAQLGNLVAFEGDLDTPGLDPDADERDDAAPTSGQPRGTVRCGATSAPVDLDDLRASVAGGIVVVQYRPEDMDAADLADLAALTQRHADAILIAPSPDLGDPVVVTGWLRRMVADSPPVPQVDSFVTAFGGLGPVDGGCSRSFS